MPTTRPALILAILLSISFAGPAPAQEVWNGGVVAADHEIASRAGLEMLERGGNAIDAAVATGFCLSVVRPYSTGLGGGGFAIVHLAGEDRTIAVDFRERAPRLVGPRHYEMLPDTLASLVGGHSIGIPGNVAGLLHLLDEYGTLDRATILAPAIRAAESGFPVDRHYAYAAYWTILEFESNPEWKIRFPFTWERFLGGGGLNEGDILRLPEQADALRMIARDGIDAYYGGPIGKAIAREIGKDRGILRESDLIGFTVKEVPPLEGSFKGKKFFTMPPPSSGGITILQILGIFERSGERLPATARNRSGYVHRLAESMKHAFADRSTWLADPRFVDIPIDRLLSSPYLSSMSARFDPRRASESDACGSRPLPEDRGTSHYCVVDGQGNAVGCTESINGHFGSLVAVPEFGFLLNNTMDDFTTRIGKKNLYDLFQSERNLPAPGKRPLSSMSPTIVLDDDGVFAVAGGSGGSRIISGTLQSLVNVILFDMSAGDAIGSPRFHHQWLPDELRLEPHFPADLVDTLTSLGHRIEPIRAVAAVQLVRRRQGGYQAASDPRKGGRPAGRNE